MERQDGAGCLSCGDDRLTSTGRGCWRSWPAQPEPTEADIDRQAAEDGNAWTEEELATAVVVYPPPTAAQVRALRARLELNQAQFALRFGFTVDTVQQYEQGRRVPSGPASTLLRVIKADPEAVIRALDPRRAVHRASDSGA